MPYIYIIIITQKDTAMKIELTQKLESAKGQLNYVNETLNSGFEFEAWEKKEYEAVKADLLEEIESLEERLIIFA